MSKETLINNNLPVIGFIRLPQVLKMIPVSKSTWWAGVKSGRYPKPVKNLGKRISAWKVEEILKFIEEIDKQEHQL